MSAAFILSTPRLLLRPLGEANAPRLAAYRNDPEVARYQGWELPFTPAIAAEFIAAMAGRLPGDPGWVQLGLEARASGELLGDVALNTSGQQAELGVTLAREAQGQGYAAEGLRALLDHAFGPLGLHRVHAGIDPRNLAVTRLLVRLGFRHEGTHRSSYLHRGEWTDEAIWAMLAAEWTR